MKSKQETKTKFPESIGMLCYHQKSHDNQSSKITIFEPKVSQCLQSASAATEENLKILKFPLMDDDDV
ncbi:hypothetical protein DERF_002621 [Dermatophagoides farinae]|uniref:Uncharacterized protein n=1 Tax=Dermatophagoides farinae TaxID=6954 RepID=A0A922L9U0_DERFA|nr:hypothetical protein DERF_002621 [Dermatophagoides farinae]